ncbi:hypothetical protein [Archangium violaceum]|uniref:hypothetical protein n=1 Tax=Archangium violaceum TaxID=83451 RepID=UPI001269C5E4|nr:hypothetical protein [Archangium violaceum]
MTPSPEGGTALTQARSPSCPCCAHGGGRGPRERRGLDVPEEGATLSLTCTVAARNTSECPVRLR